MRQTIKINKVAENGYFFSSDVIPIRAFLKQVVRDKMDSKELRSLCRMTLGGSARKATIADRMEGELKTKIAGIVFTANNHL